jgi:endonuclease/exonuclease/phosphatase family metal-dependent hydrolase
VDTIGAVVGVIRFATWNVSWISRSDAAHGRKIAYLLARDWDVLALQEVTPEFVEAIRTAGVADECCYPGDLRGGRFASALLGRNGFTFTRRSLIAELPRPRQGIAAYVTGDGDAFEVLSWHAPNAARKADRPLKRAGYVAFIAWAEARQGPLLVGTDANHGSFYSREEDFPGSPFKVGFPRDEWWEENEWWTRADPDLRDAWIQYLADNPEVLARVRGEWKGGPSAVSYTRGSKAAPVPDRFDYVLASPEFSVRSVDYDYEGSRAAGSDHAFLSAELVIDRV